MSFSYDETALATSALFRVRFMIGDTEQGAGVLPNSANYTDEAIEYQLTRAGQDDTAAAVALLRLAGQRWTRLPQSFSADGLSVNRGDMLAKLSQAADELESSLGGGGISSHPLELLDLTVEE